MVEYVHQNKKLYLLVGHEEHKLAFKAPVMTDLLRSPTEKSIETTNKVVVY